MEKPLPTLQDFEREAEEFARTLRPREGGATIVMLAGELGAGKTTFVKTVAKSLGVSDTLNSPTFVLEKIYDLPIGAHFTKLIHIDLYRLKGPEDLAPLKLKELMDDSKNLIMIEWPERAPVSLLANSKIVMFTTLPDGIHTIAYA